MVCAAVLDSNLLLVSDGLANKHTFNALFQGIFLGPLN